MTIGRTKSYVAVRGAATYFPIGVPPPPQHKFGEHIRRQMLCKTFGAFAFDDAKQHALAVDIANLQGDDFAGAKSCAVGDRERRLMFEILARRNQTADLFSA